MSAPVHPAVGVRTATHRRAAIAVATVAVALLLGACTSLTAGKPAAMSTAEKRRSPLAYPPAERGPVTDTYGSVAVADPYRWMEDAASPALQSWIAAENALAERVLAAIPARERVKARLTALWNYERYGAGLASGTFELPERRGERYFYLRNDGLQDQSVMYVTEGIDGAPRVLLDPNTLSRDATVALANYAISPDGRYLLYATSDGGTDWKTWQLRDVATARDLPDRLLHTKFTTPSWTPDGRSVYYSRYPVDDQGRADDSRQVAIYRHLIGTSQAADQLVFAVDDHPTRDPYGTVTSDGRYLVINLEDGYAANGIAYLDLQTPGSRAQPLFDRWDGLYAYLGKNGDELLFSTTQAAPLGRIIAVDVARPGGTVRTVVPEGTTALREASFVGGVLVAQYLEDAHSVVRSYRPDGQLLTTLQLPGAGTVTGFKGPSSERETFFSYTDFLTPRAIYRYDVLRDAVQLFRQPRVAIDLSPFETRQVFYTSKDGTRIPMFITARRGLQLDGRQPTLLYGYGGFNEPITPGFAVPIAVWLEMGGVYAVANLRGGGEYGEGWHAAGTRLQKQNVFDDFIAAAEWLIAQGYTSPAKLAIQGRSNGGLLVGAVLTQRPELFGAALPAVGVLDMLRYHTASANARQWGSDYGLSENAADFGALYAYSPYHRVRPGTCYPPTLITTADRDDRVVPWHSFKFGAALQYAQGCANPILVRIETRAGHGAGKPTWMQIEDWADHWSFLIETLGLQPALP